MRKRYIQQSTFTERPVPPKLIGSFFIEPAPSSRSLLNPSYPQIPEFLDDNGDDMDQKKDGIFNDAASVDVDTILSDGGIHHGVNVSTSCSMLEVS